MILEWPCKWKGCKVVLSEEDVHKATKYCTEHRISSIKLIRKKTNAKRSSLRKLQKPKKCLICQKKLNGNSTKYCSDKCLRVDWDKKRMNKRTIKSIKFHAKEVLRLMERI